MVEPNGPPVVPSRPTWNQIPQSMKDQLLNTMKSKLPTPVDDSILMDILETHYNLMDAYLDSYFNQN